MEKSYLILLLILLLNFIFYINLGNLNNYFKFYDYPQSGRKIHSKKVSLLGCSFFFLSLILFFIFDYYFFFHFKNISYFSLILSFSTLFVIGIVDDLKDLRALYKSLIFLVIIMSILLSNDIFVIREIKFLFNDTQFYLGKFSFVFTTLCIFLFINAFNMFDGINGQASLYTTIIFSYFLFKGILIELSLVILICSFFFTYFNLKNKIFLGDNGSLLISLLISLIVIKSYNENIINSCEEIFILMMLPGIDMARLFFDRILKKKSPFSADGNHFHHILLKKFKFRSVLLINLSIILVSIMTFLVGLKPLFIIMSFLIIYFSIFFYCKKY